jgi:two-component system, OmpR family, phosphate regulon response regulator PhoB
MSEAAILVVEDEEAIREMLVMALGQAGFTVLQAADAAQAQTVLEHNRTDLILLDWMLPGMSGVEWARRLRKNRRHAVVPIILVTARGEEEDKVRGLEVGADDYVAKPFSPRELVARIRAVLRRSGQHEQEHRIELEGIVLDTEEHHLSIDREPVTLSPTEFRLLAFFMTHPNKVYSRSQLLDEVWGRSTFIEERTVDVHIRRLRKILAEHQRDQLIQTVRGFGYRFSLQ